MIIFPDSFRSLRTFSFITLVFASLACAADSPVPGAIQYQGRLTNAQGETASDGSAYEIEVRFWSEPTGGDFLWGERHGNVSTHNGAFNIVLGSNDAAALDSTIFTDIKAALAESSVYLGLTVTKTGNGTPIANPEEMLPRQQWLTVPFSVRSDIAEISKAVVNDGVTTAMLQDAAVTREKLAVGAAVPPGTVVAFIGDEAPLGWLMCDGSEVSRTAYPSLASVADQRFGAATNSNTHFKLPDFRGYFLRGKDGGIGRDPDRASRLAMAPGGAIGDEIGSIQADEFETHAHRQQVGQDTNASGSITGWDLQNTTSITDVEDTKPTGGNETRPINAYVNYIIKY